MIKYIILFALIIIPLFALENLKLEDAKLKLLNNLEVKISDNVVKQTILDIQKINNSRFGQLDIEQTVMNTNDAGNIFVSKLKSRQASFGDFGFSEFDGTNPNILSVTPEDLNNPDSDTYYNSKLTYMLPIFVGFKMQSYSDILKSVKKINTMDSKNVYRLKNIELERAYYSFRLLKVACQNLKFILKNVNQLEETTEFMVELGYAKKIDIMEVATRKENVKRFMFQVSSHRKVLLSYISFLINEDVISIIPPEDDLAYNTNVDKILNNNIMKKKADENIIIKQRMIDIAKSGYYPQVVGFGELSTTNDRFMKDAGTNNSYTAGVVVKLNLYNGQDYLEHEKAKLDLIKGKDEQSLVNSQLRLEVKKTLIEIEGLDNELMVLKKELEYHIQIYLNYTERYKESLVSINDVIIKESEQLEKVLEIQKLEYQRNEKIFYLKTIGE